MRRIYAVVAAIGLSASLVLGASTLLVADSPYDDNVHVERNPVAPDRPAGLNATSATEHALAYERIRLENDLLASRNHTLDTHDTMIARCNATSVSETDAGRFRVQLRCAGGIDDTKRLFGPGEFTYEVAYRVTETETTQIEIRDYPFDERDTLRPRRS